MKNAKWRMGSLIMRGEKLANDERVELADVKAGPIEFE
jgi:hypothetical protein